MREGKIQTHHLLGDRNDPREPRKLNAEMAVTDESFNLNMKPDSIRKEDLYMEQAKNSKNEFDNWAAGEAHRLSWYSEWPKVSVVSFGIGFLRTTNLLMPGRHVIDINEGIGLRIPKDLVLDGDVEKEN